MCHNMPWIINYCHDIFDPTYTQSVIFDFEFPENKKVVLHLHEVWKRENMSTKSQVIIRIIYILYHI